MWASVRLRESAAVVRSLVGFASESSFRQLSGWKDNTRIRQLKYEELMLAMCYQSMHSLAVRSFLGKPVDGPAS